MLHDIYLVLISSFLESFHMSGIHYLLHLSVRKPMEVFPFTVYCDEYLSTVD